MSVVSFVAAQRTDYRVPHAVTCRLLEVSESWFYKWQGKDPTVRQRRQCQYRLKIDPLAPVES